MVILKKQDPPKRKQLTVKRSISFKNVQSSFCQKTWSC